MTHYWNPADSFAAGATAPPTAGGPALQHYIKLIPWVTDPVHGSLGTGFGYTSAYFSTTGMFYSGWNANTQSKGARAAVSTGLTNQNVPSPIAMMPRAIEIEDADVSMGVQLQSSDPTYIAANGATFMAGVGARLSAGTVAGSTIYLSRLQGGHGYWFVLLMDTASGAKFELLRVNSSTVTRLAETPIGAATFATFASLNASSPRTMRMTVTTESGNVRIRCYTASASLGLVEEEMFNVLDSSGSKLTGAGRCGLLLGSEFQRTVAPATIRRVAPVCSFFQIKSGADVLHREEWVRTHLDYGFRRYPGFSTHEAEYIGNSLMSGWSGDIQYSNTPTMIHDAAGGRIVVNANGIALKDHWWFSARPADDLRRQDRTIVVRFDTSGGSANAAERHAGIFLRGTPQAATADAKPIACYYATISISDTTGVVTVQARRRTQAGGDQLLAQDTTQTVTVDANIVVGLGVQTLAPDLINGYAQIDMTINGVAVPFVDPPSPILGVAISSGGSVVDATSLRVLQGKGEGIRVLCQTLNPRNLYVDTWALGASSGPVDLPENDQASIEVAPEYTTTVGTLTLPMETSVTVEKSETTIRHELDSDHVYTGVMHEFERRTWNVTINAWTENERDEFLDLMDLAEAEEIEGRVGAIDWTPPGAHEAPTVVHVLEEVQVMEQIVPQQAYAARFKLEELHAP